MMFISSSKGDLDLEKVLTLLLIIATIVVVVLIYIAVTDKGNLVVAKIRDVVSFRELFS